jgi:hypothetical protein
MRLTCREIHVDLVRRLAVPEETTALMLRRATETIRTLHVHAL